MHAPDPVSFGVMLLFHFQYQLPVRSCVRTVDLAVLRREAVIPLELLCKSKTIVEDNFKDREEHAGDAC